MKRVGEVLELWDANGRISFLKNACDIRVREVVNGDFYVQFMYPMLDADLERYGMLTEQLDVVFPQEVENGQKFRIRKVDEVRQGKKIYKVVEAHHVAFTLGNFFFDAYIDFAAAKTLPQMLTMLDAGTPFTFVVEGNFAAQDIFDFGEKKKIELLQELRQLYNAELTFNNYEITLTTRKGGNYGAYIGYRHNMIGVKRKSHDMERITRLYGYGKNGLTIEGLPGHLVKFIDSPHYDSNNPYMGKVDFPDIEDQARLLQEMKKYLAKYELPSVSYDADFVQMEKVDCEFLNERLREAGDTVTCYDEVLGYSFDARAIEYERYPFERESGRVILSNFREFKTADYIFQATVGSKKAIEYTSKNAVLKGQKYDDSITLVDGLGMLVSDDHGRPMVRLGQTGPGEYGQTMYNKQGDKTIWQDAATGDARFKGKLEASEFIGGSIRIGSSFSVNTSGHMIAVGGEFSGEISATIFTGGQIYGTVITGALIQTSESSYPRAEMSSTDKMFKVAQSLTKYAEFRANYNAAGGATVPALRFVNGSDYMDVGGIGPGGIFGIHGYNDIYLLAYGKINQFLTDFNSWSSIRNASTGRSMQQELDSLTAAINSLASAVATKGVSTGSAGPYNAGIPIGTQLMKGDGNTVTWNGIPLHTHTQN